MYCCRDGLMTRKWWKFHEFQERSWSVSSMCESSLLVLQSSRKKEHLVFQGISKEHGTFAISYVLMGLLKGVKYSLSNSLNRLWGFKYFLVVQCAYFERIKLLHYSKKESSKLCQNVHYVLCVIVFYVVVNGFVTKRYMVMICWCSREWGQRVLIARNPQNWS